MITRIKRRTLENFAIVILSIALVFSVFLGVSFTGDVISATNITNVSVLARVNISNTEPNITSIVIDDSLDTPANEIDLIANGLRTVHCNATVFDFNGAGDINASSVNATLYINSVGSQGTTDNNHRYRNESCQRCTAQTATTTQCDCQFALQYYANDSSSWLCNVSLRDLGGSSGTLPLGDADVSSTPVTVTKLLAINTSTLLDYGNLSVSQTSGEMTHNVTNGGNINLNISLRGFGGTDDIIGQNVTMICEFGNITIGNQRYYVGSSGIPFADMITLTNKTVR